MGFETSRVYGLWDHSFLRAEHGRRWAAGCPEQSWMQVSVNVQYIKER